MNIIVGKIISIWVQIRDSFLYFFCQALIVNAYVDDLTWSGIRHRNWGDDLNYYLLKKLTGRPVVFRHNFKLAKWFHFKNYLCIGTLLDGKQYKNAETIVWGSGCSGEDRSLTIPKFVASVRGRLSREYLLSQGVACPEVYGDPAILLPLVYRPKVKKKYKLGIVPHVQDLYLPVVETIRKDCQDILVIDLAHYEDWRDIIDAICSCEKIASSSLHGLIVSDAYGVPNCWIELGGKINSARFKYRDYASGIGRNLDEPIRIDAESQLSLLESVLSQWEEPQFDIKALLGSCPFPFKQYYCDDGNCQKMSALN